MVWALGDFLMNTRGKVTLIDKSVVLWAKGSFKYGIGKCFRGKCIGYNESGIFEVNHDFGEKTQKRCCRGVNYTCGRFVDFWD